RVRMRGHEFSYARAGGGLPIPMDRHKNRATLLAVADDHFEHAAAMAGRDSRQAAIDQPRGIVRMHFYEWLGPMCAKCWSSAGAGDGMPRVANAPGIEKGRKVSGRSFFQRRSLSRYEAGLGIGREKPAGGEKSPLSRHLACGQRPLHGIEF